MEEAVTKIGYTYNAECRASHLMNGSGIFEKEDQQKYNHD